MSWSAPDWIYSRGETNPPGDNRFESSEGLRVGVEAGYDRRSGVSLRAPGGHSCVTRSRNQADTPGHREDTKKIQFEYRRNRADTTGHERTRHCAGSGP